MPRSAIAAIALLTLSACNERAADPVPEPSESTPSPPIAVPTNSIFDPEAKVEPAREAPEPRVEVISFAKSGSELDPAASKLLDTLLESVEAKEGGAIVIRGHSDAGGSDAVNQRISRQRAEAVHEYLAGKGVESARITVIAFGSQNPVEPNALPDGTPNDAGRAANRRVEITILPPDERQPEQASE